MQFNVLLFSLLQPTEFLWHQGEVALRSSRSWHNWDFWDGWQPLPGHFPSLPRGRAPRGSQGGQTLFGKSQGPPVCGRPDGSCPASTRRL